MTVTSCCCCFSLRTGSLILAILGTISSFISFHSGIKFWHGDQIVEGLGFIIYGLCIYAIIKEKPALILPALTTSVISTFVPICLAIISFVYYVACLVALSGQLPSKEQERMEKMELIALLLCVIYSLISALSFHFCCVLYAFYKELKNAAGNYDNRSLV